MALDRNNLSLMNEVEWKRPNDMVKSQQISTLTNSIFIGYKKGLTLMTVLWHTDKGFYDVRHEFNGNFDYVAIINIPED